MYTWTYDEAKATPEMKGTIAMIERAIAGEAIDWLALYEAIPLHEEWELEDWARKRLDSLEEGPYLGGPLTGGHYVLNRVIAEVYAFRGNPHPMATFLAMTEPGSEEAQDWARTSAQFAELLPDSVELSRHTLPCTYRRAAKPVRRRRRRGRVRRRRAKRPPKKW